MKFRYTSLLAVLSLGSLAMGELDTCSLHVSDLCLEMGREWVSGACTATFGKFAGNAHSLEKLTSDHLATSFKMLVMANEFSTDNVNRMGFHKLFQDMSDQSWNNAKKILRHFVKRGGKLESQFNISKLSENVLGVEEVQALGISLDLMKKTAENVGEAIRHAQSRKHDDANPQQDSYDPEIAHFLEDELLEKYADQIFGLAKKTNLLGRMVRDDKSRGMGLHLFDQHLQK